MKSTLLSVTVLFFSALIFGQEKPKTPQPVSPKVISTIPKTVGITPNTAGIISSLNVNWNFETANLNTWTASGNAFTNQPTQGPVSVRKNDVLPGRCADGSAPVYPNGTWNHGIQGNYWISSGENHPAASAPLTDSYINNTTGTLLSGEFVVPNKIISFLLAGKSASKNCSVDILVADDGTISATEEIAGTPTTTMVGNKPITSITRVTIQLPRVTIDGKNYFVVSSIVNTADTKNDIVRTSNAAEVYGLDLRHFKRMGVMLSPAYHGKKARIRITDNDAAGFISVDDFRFEDALSAQPVIQRPAAPDCPLEGIVDLHTHPMSYLGFGKKAVHGVPDTGMIIPAGTYQCNAASFRATSIEQALGSCNSTHGGFGLLDNKCGDYLRAAMINYALDDKFKYRVAFERNPHGDHEHAGYPNFAAWPHESSILHQQMWIDWIRRAHKGGINTIVALTVNSELLAEISNGDGPFDDKTVADNQIDEMILMARRNSDFMEIAYSATDMRRIVRAGKLAVILGMEIDKIGNFGKPGVVTNDMTVRAEIRRLYAKGIRYAFPVHLIDNSFGGAAVYNMLFNFANKHANGSHFNVTTATDPDIRYSANILSDAPIGTENAIILGVKGTLEAIAQTPAPCADCFPPGRVACCGSYQKILNVLNPSPAIDLYKLIPPGHMNVNSLTPLGEVAINEMMKLGIMIDIDHMGERSMTRAIEIAENIAGGTDNDYPLMMGHNEIRGTSEHTMKERSAPDYLVRRVAALGGMFGVGTANSNPKDFIKNASNAMGQMANKNIAIGTDVNGFERLPNIGTGGRTKFQDMQLASFLSTFNNQFGFCRTGNKTWNYVTDGGVSHYGMMPEFFWDVKNFTGGDNVMNQLSKSAEGLALYGKK